MKKKVQVLTHDNFKPYGTYITQEEVNVKNDPVNFYAADSLVSMSEFSSMHALTIMYMSPRPFEIAASEYHVHTEEIYGGFTEDTIMHVGLPSESPKAEDIELFLLPAGAYCRIKRGVWHMAPHVMGKNRVGGLVLLPPYTYTHDCFVKQLDEVITFEPVVEK